MRKLKKIKSHARLISKVCFINFLIYCILGYTVYCSVFTHFVRKNKARKGDKQLIETILYFGMHPHADYIRTNISGATGLPPSLSQFVFCQYRFPGEEEISTVPPVFTPNPKAIEIIRVL